MNHEHRRVVRPKLKQQLQQRHGKDNPALGRSAKAIATPQSKECGHTRPRAWVEAPELATDKAASTGRTSNALSRTRGIKETRGPNT